MNFLDFSFIHSCNVIQESQDQRLLFTNGTKEFTVSSVLTGGSSDATGTVKSLTLSSGSWRGGTASGYLILSFTEGSFEDGETITDDASGNAKASGTLVLETDTLGTPTTTTKLTPHECFFTKKVTVSASVNTTDAGKMLYFYDLVYLPDTAIVEKGDFISTTETGFAELYEVQDVDYADDPFLEVFDHVEAYLKAVTKRD